MTRSPATEPGSAALPSPATALATGASATEAAVDVSTTATAAPAGTVAPSGNNHSISVYVVSTVFSFGTVMSNTGDLPQRVRDRFRPHKHVRLQVRGRRDHALARLDHHDPVPQRAPEPVVDLPGHLGRPGPAAHGVIDDADPLGARQGRRQWIEIEGVQPGRDEELAGQLELDEQLPGGGQRSGRQAARRDDRHVDVARILDEDAGDAPCRVEEVEAEQVIDHAVGVHAARVEGLVLEQDAGFAAVHQPLQQSNVVVERRHLEQREVRDAQQMLVRALAVRWPVAPVAAYRTADDQVHRDPAAVHGHRLRGEVEDLVEPEGDEVTEHDLDDRPGSAQRHARRNTQDPALADRRGDHRVRVRGGEPPADLEGAAVGVENVLAQKADPGVLSENGVQRPIQIVCYPFERSHADLVVVRLPNGESVLYPNSAPIYMQVSLSPETLARAQKGSAVAPPRDPPGEILRDDGVPGRSRLQAPVVQYWSWSITCEEITTQVVAAGYVSCHVHGIRGPQVQRAVAAPDRAATAVVAGDRGTGARHRWGRQGRANGRRGTEHRPPGPGRAGPCRATAGACLAKARWRAQAGRDPRSRADTRSGSADGPGRRRRSHYATAMDLPVDADAVRRAAAHRAPGQRLRGTEAAQAGRLHLADEGQGGAGAPVRGLGRPVPVPERTGRRAPGGGLPGGERGRDQEGPRRRRPARRLVAVDRRGGDGAATRMARRGHRSRHDRPRRRDHPTLVAAVWTARPRDQRSAPGHLDMLVEQRARRPGQPHWAHRNGVPHAAGYVALEPDRTAAGGAAHHPRARTTTHPARGRGADHPGRRSPRRQGCGTRAGSRRPWHGRAGGCRNGHTPYLSWRMELQPAPEDLFPGTGWPGSLLGELIPRMARCGRLCDRIPYVLS